MAATTEAQLAANTTDMCSCHCDDTLSTDKEIGYIGSLVAMTVVLVCMAVYLASFAKDLAGKMVAIWFLISSFIALGLEHSVANMFIIPLGIFHGASVTWKVRVCAQ